MKKKTIIKSIKKIINEFGSFGLGELENVDSSPCVGTLGNFFGLVEYFKPNTVEVNIYSNGSDSDPVDYYEMAYEELDKDILNEILIFCEWYEVEQLKTEKRISN